MPELEMLIEQFAETRFLDPKNNEEDRVEVKPGVPVNYIEDALHPEFRLFLTSMPCSYFPITTLQNGVKLTNEPPKGIKANMLKVFSEFPDDILTKDVDDNKKDAFRNLLFSFCLFHAVILERRKFGPLGYNILYDFNDSDLETTIKSLKIMLRKYPDVPWNALRFQAAEINYGGRVTDDWDRRVVSTVLDIFFMEDSLTPGFRYTQANQYYVPEGTTVPQLIDLIKEYPEQDPSAIFGMNSNAEISYQVKETKKSLDTVLSLQSADTVEKKEGEKTPDEIVMDFCEKLQSEDFPKLILKEKESAPTISDYSDPLQVCLVQEVERFNRLLNYISKYGSELEKAVKGELIMTEELEQGYFAILNNQVPVSWTKLAYQSLKNLASWYADLMNRVSFFRKWYVEGKPTTFWLPAFYFPQGFLTSVLQHNSRTEKIAIDQLGFVFEFKNVDASTITAKPEKGCFIRGLFMEGCRYDGTRNMLGDNPPGQMYSPSPVIFFIPATNPTLKPTDYTMPLYKTSKRAGGGAMSFVLAIQVPTKLPPEYWILNGAAFVCDRGD